MMVQQKNNYSKTNKYKTVNHITVPYCVHKFHVTIMYIATCRGKEFHQAVVAKQKFFLKLARRHKVLSTTSWIRMLPAILNGWVQ